MNSEANYLCLVEFKQIQRDIGRIEKWVLRKAFDDEKSPYLPRVCLFRSLPF
jgi:asparagine synthase (glutamine-hydrolysing)